MTSKLIVNSVRHTGASADGITMAADGSVTFPGTSTCTGNVTCSNDLSVDNNLKADSGFGSTAVMYGVRVWADFYWNSGTPTARNSGNVSSLTDNGAGDITVNFTMQCQIFFILVCSQEMIMETHLILALM